MIDNDPDPILHNNQLQFLTRFMDRAFQNNRNPIGRLLKIELYRAFHYRTLRRMPALKGGAASRVR